MTLNFYNVGGGLSMLTVMLISLTNPPNSTVLDRGCPIRGMRLYETKDLKGAEAALREAIRLDPNDAKIPNKLGGLLYEQRKFEQAIKEYRQALRIDPNFAAAHSNLGLALIKQGKFEEGIAEYRQAIVKLVEQMLQQGDLSINIESTVY